MEPPNQRNEHLDPGSHSSHSPCESHRASIFSSSIPSLNDTRSSRGLSESASHSIETRNSFLSLDAFVMMEIRSSLGSCFANVSVKEWQTHNSASLGVSS